MTGWLVFSVFLFFITTPERAVIISVFGGILFLPVYTIDYPGIPALNKNTVVALGILIGGGLSGGTKEYPLYLRPYDIPMLLWCFVVPMATSLSNNLGLYYGLSVILENYLGWGVFYWAGRRYFGKLDTLKSLTRALIIGGMLYIPLIFFEIRMSPRINVILYGFFAAEWRQHFRYGGYRPIVFMEHGIMLSLFMAVAAMVAFWLWRNKSLTTVGHVPIAPLTIILIVASILCRTASGWFFLVIGIGIYFLYKKNNSKIAIRVLIILVPLYIIARLTNVISSGVVQLIASFLFDNERVASLSLRLMQENLFSLKALSRPFLGWGGYGRAWPVDPVTGTELIPMIDSLWVKLFGWYGFLGLTSVFSALGIGPWCVSNKNSNHSNTADINKIVLSIVVVFFMIDSLFNGMINPMYILIAGALLSNYLQENESFLLLENRLK